MSSQPTVSIDLRNLGHDFSGIARYTQTLAHALMNCPGRGELRYLVEKGHQPPEWLPSGPAIVTHPTDSALVHSIDLTMRPITARPSVVTCHDLIPLQAHRLLRHSVKGRLSPAWRAWVYARLRTCNRIVAISHETARSISALFPGLTRPIEIIPNGIPAPPDRHPLPTNHPIYQLPHPLVLYVGRSDPYKNLRGLVLSFAKAISCGKRPGHLAIAGTIDPRYQQALLTVRQLRLEQHVTFLGRLPENALEELFAKADIFAFPSMMEGCGLPPLEAMARGVATLALNRSAMPEMLGDGAILVDKPYGRNMSSALLRLMVDPQYRNRQALKGIAVARKWMDLNRLGRAYWDAYGRTARR